MIEVFQTLKKFYKLSSSLSFQDAQQLIKAAHTETFPAGSYLMEAGTRSQKIYLVRKGLLRVYLVNDKGSEITTGLRWENQIYANTDVILFERPSRFYVQALEKTSVFSMEFDKAQAILERNPELEKNRKYVLRNLLKHSLEHTESFVLYSAEERYQNYIDKNPDIVNRVPGKYIANILGITPVSLSRIRKRLVEKERAGKK